MENKEIERYLGLLIKEKDNLGRAGNEETKNIESSPGDFLKIIFDDNEKLRFQLETRQRDLELRGQELMKRETHNEAERKKLAEDLEENAVEKSSIQAAIEEIRKAGEKIMKLAQGEKEEWENLHTRMILLGKQMDGKQALELEIQQLRGGALRKKDGEIGDLETLSKL